MTSFQSHGIGIVGAGEIVEHGHLPAYLQGRLPVRSIYDQDARCAECVAGMSAEVVAVRSLDQLLDDRNVDIIDIAVPPGEQVDIAYKAIDRGKHVLCQKPLARSLREAEQLVDFAITRGVKLAVNQQMRWSPMIRAVEESTRRGDIGQPSAAWVRIDLISDLCSDHWLAREPRLMALYGTIHFLDSARYLFGEPTRVTARLTKDAGQIAVGETWINAWIEWPNGLLLVIFERYCSKARDPVSMMQVEGTAGAIRCRFGLWEDYPRPVPDVVERIDYETGKWTTVSDRECWMPDAFAGPMIGLIEAIEHNTEPPTSGTDNLSTLRLVESLYASSESRSAVNPNDIH